MTLLAPLMLLGLLGLGLPLLAHLRGRDTPRPVRFAGLRFLAASDEVLAQRRRVAGWSMNIDGPQEHRWTCGVWGHKALPESVLRDGDRVELDRDLRVDPKVARRERFVGQGPRNAGLFAQRRPKSKAGN